ncbi:DUF4434 domain-containing protein [Variovorax sp. HJSM1_2]|uniref:DUF4434 domain-containing protein n=1 Tax=Variovorax sp. HJSM1_2 TaxID=3366263 RepID=UPI003BC17399
MQWCGALLAGGAAGSLAAAPTEACCAARGRTIIWQPWASHAALDERGWKRLGELARREGYSRVLLQWSRYGSTDFWPLEGRRWLQAGMAHWREQQLRLIVGLDMGEDYYRVLQQSDDALRAHMAGSLGRSVDLMRRLALQPPPLVVDGWYVPQEIDDLNWRHPARERLLRAYLASVCDALTREGRGQAGAPVVYASAFFSGASPPGEFAGMLSRLHRETGVIWIVQDGLGTSRLSEARTAAYLRAIAQALPTESWEGILEVFDQHQPKGQAPTFDPSAEATIFRRQAIWRNSIGREPGMTFSLNQRMAKLDGAEH